MHVIDQTSAISYIESVTLREDATKRWSVLGHFEGDSTAHILARIGLGEVDTLSEAMLEATARQVAEAVYELHRTTWLQSRGCDQVSGMASIRYDDTDAMVGTSYRAVVLEVEDKTQEFATGNPVQDWQAMMRVVLRECGVLMRDSSCYDFASDVAGYRWDGEDNLVANEHPASEPEQSLHGHGKQ